MNEIYYKKKGRRYVPASVYNSNLISAIPYGFHMLHVREDLTSYHYRVDPAKAPVLAACKDLKEKLRDAVTKAAELKLTDATLKDKKFMKAWNNFQAELGKSIAGRSYGNYLSRTELVDAVMKVIEAEVGA